MTSSYGIVERAASGTDADQHAERIRVSGVSVVPGGYAPDEIAYLSRRIDALLVEQADRAGGIDILAEIGEHETLRCCLAHDEAFVRLASNPRVMDVCRQLLGDYIVLMQQNAIVNPPGRAHRQTACHRDLPYQHFVSSRPLAISALFCVDPFTRENGATIVLPGTHRIEQFPSETRGCRDRAARGSASRVVSLVRLDALSSGRTQWLAAAAPRRQPRLYAPVHRAADFAARCAGRSLCGRRSAGASFRISDKACAIGRRLVDGPAGPQALSRRPPEHGEHRRSPRERHPGPERRFQPEDQRQRFVCGRRRYLR